MPRPLALALAAFAALATHGAAAQTAAKSDCVDVKPSSAAPGASKGSDVGVAKDGPGTTGWSSGNSEAGIQKDGKAPTPEAKQPETAKGLDPTKRPC